MQRPICVLLLPRTLEQFILRDQAEDLLRSDGVVAVEPASVPYGAPGDFPMGAYGHSGNSTSPGGALRLDIEP